MKVNESDTAAGMSNHHNITRSNLLFFINYQWITSVWKTRGGGMTWFLLLIHIRVDMPWKSPMPTETPLGRRLSVALNLYTHHQNLSPALSQCTLIFNRGIVCRFEGTTGYGEISVRFSWFTSIISLLMAPWGRILQGKAKRCHPR